jgi:hypothetical protein
MFINWVKNIFQIKFELLIKTYLKYSKLCGYIPGIKVVYRHFWTLIRGVLYKFVNLVKKFLNIFKEIRTYIFY